MVQRLRFQVSVVDIERTMSAQKGRSEDRSYTDWMSQLPPELHNNPLHNLTIPGMKLLTLLMQQCTEEEHCLRCHRVKCMVISPRRIRHITTDVFCSTL